MPVLNALQLLPSVYSIALGCLRVVVQMRRYVPQIVDRVRWKAATYGQDAASAPEQGSAATDSSSEQRYKVAPDTVAMLYDKWVMPMTKQVQVRLYMYHCIAALHYARFAICII